MNKKAVIDQTVTYVKSILDGEATGHDWWHIYRVWKNAVHIGRKEKADMFIVELAALLHDLDDWKLQKTKTTNDLPLATAWMVKMGIDRVIMKNITQIIHDLSFKGAKVVSKMESIEGMIVQDADRLDALGAIGIARCLAYGGHKGYMIHDPSFKPKLHTSFEDYKKSTGTSINHFYEKLLLLKDLMNTKTAKKIAEKRHKFMEKYLEKFYKEWEGRQ